MSNHQDTSPGNPPQSTGDVAGRAQRLADRLSASEARNRLLSAALSEAGDVVIITDPHGTIEWVNAAFLRLSGYSENEIVGATLRSVNSGVKSELLYDDLWDTISSGAVGRRELVERHKDGHPYTVQQTITPLLGDDGSIEHFVAIHKDVTERQLALRALHRVNAQMRLILSQLPVLAWTTDLDLRPSFTDVSPLYASTIEAAGERLPMEPHPENPVAREAALQALAGRASNFEFEWDDRWWRARVEALHGQDGAVQGTVGMALDVTEARGAEDELRRSQAWLQALVDTSPDAIMFADDEGRCLEVNPAAETLTGYSREELLAMRTSDLVAPDTIATEGAERIHAFASEGADDDTFVIRRKDGTTCEAEYRAVADIRAGVHLAVMRNITEHKAMVRRLATSEAEFRRLAEHATDIVARLRFENETTLRVEYVNPAATEILGYPRERFYADPTLFRRIVEPQELRSVPEDLPTVGAPQQSSTIRVRHRDGGWVWLEVHASLTDATADVPVFQVVARDITTRREAEQALVQILEGQRQVAIELRTINAMKDTLLRSVSHELRTPLTSILGFASTLTRHADRIDQQQTAAFHRNILDHAERLRRLLDDMTTVDRLTRQQGQPDRSPTALATLVREVVARTDLGDHPVELSLDDVVIDVEGVQVERALECLLDNVVRHTPPSTRLCISLDRSEEGVRLVFDDDGPGLPLRGRPRLFEPFRQDHRAAASSSPGTGLGLAVVAAVARMHGGVTAIDDGPHGGARIVMTLKGSLRDDQGPPSRAG